MSTAVEGTGYQGIFIKCIAQCLTDTNIGKLFAVHGHGDQIILLRRSLLNPVAVDGIDAVNIALAYVQSLIGFPVSRAITRLFGPAMTLICTLGVAGTVTPVIFIGCQV